MNIFKFINYFIFLVPPTEAIIMDEFGQHLHGIIGPYNEGQPVSLICEGEGGKLSETFFMLFFLFY